MSDVRARQLRHNPQLFGPVRADDYVFEPYVGHAEPYIKVWD